MAADSNVGFYAGVQKRHMLSFQSGAVVSGAGMAAGGIGGAGEMNGNGGGGMFLGGNSGMVSHASGLVQVGGSSGKGYLEFKADSVLTPEWTPEEHRILIDGLGKFANVHGVMKYIKIASTLRRKTVRDVAMRCRWIANNAKRRKLDEHYAGKNLKDRKEKMVDSFSKASINMARPDNNASYSPLIHHTDQNMRFTRGVPVLGSATQQLMDDNARILNLIANNLIATNLPPFKILENVDLFYHARNNIATILNTMNNMPGIMSQMPPFQEQMNEDLLHEISRLTDQDSMFGAPNSGVHLEQQQRFNNLL